MHERDDIYYGNKAVEYYYFQEPGELARNANFRKRAAQALLLTANLSAPESELEPSGVREYGFGGYIYKDPYAYIEGSKIHFTPIFPGERYNIAFENFYHYYTARSGELTKPAVFFHTHPDNYANDALLFSCPDLMHFSWHTLHTNPDLIFSVGANTSPDGKTAKLLMIQFSNMRDVFSFDPVQTYRESDNYHYTSMKMFLPRRIVPSFKRDG